MTNDPRTVPTRLILYQSNSIPVTILLFFCNLNINNTHVSNDGVHFSENSLEILATIFSEKKFVGQNCRNFELVSKILSDDKFCPSKILSNISIKKSCKNRTKLSKFLLGVENFVRRNILSVQNFVR